MARIVLGIDPGFGRMGFGIVDRAGGGAKYVGSGVIETHPGTPHELRLAEIARDLRDLIGEVRPSEIVIEKLFFKSNVSTAIRVAEARGVALLVAAELGVRVREVSPQDVKLAVTGVGNAVKSQVQKMTAAVLGLKEIPQPDDACDALAAALC